MKIKEMFAKISGKKAPILFWSLVTACACYWFLKKNVRIDDAFIYFRLALNLLKTGKPEFNIGDNTFVATSPLWLGMLALVKMILPFLALELIAKTLWIILLSVASYFAYLTLFPRIKEWACFSPIPLFLTPVIGFFIGNEIALLYAALFFTIWACERRLPFYCGLGLGIGYLARGEFILLVVPICFRYLLLSRNANKATKKEVLGELLKITIVAFLVALPWHAYYFASFTGLFPDTLRIKMFQARSPYWPLYQTRLWYYATMLMGGRYFLLFFVAIGALWQWDIFFLFALYTIIHVLVYTFLGVPDYWWYYYDIYILISFFMFLGVFRIIDFARTFAEKHGNTDALKKGVIFAFYLILSGFVLWFNNLRMNAFENTLNLGYNNYKTVSGILREKLNGSDVVLTAEVGILSYFLSNQVIRDPNGIASPHVLPENINNCGYFVGQYKPRYLILKADGAKELSFSYDKATYIYKQLGIVNAHNLQGCCTSAIYELVKRSDVLIKAGKK